ncbi:hypothetical protein WOLCODRAFT_161098 [Wolfiporia cocos MD-104 SS10]|uniref:Uncharacterized protein n=1 Tax=Wolfiporia cocos (strain MD-104) TaxID=742152 RepID=A0A2H3JDG7_WOLCO|nr:hypothetical protein WOLCODRAFT_161098 [Wolfiporia cocos MD-104 SS10]
MSRRAPRRATEDGPDARPPEARIPADVAACRLSARRGSSSRRRGSAVRSWLGFAFASGIGAARAARVAAGCVRVYERKRQRDRNKSVDVERAENKTTTKMAQRSNNKGWRQRKCVWRRMGVARRAAQRAASAVASRIARVGREARAVSSARRARREERVGWLCSGQRGQDGVIVVVIGRLCSAVLSSTARAPSCEGHSRAFIIVAVVRAKAERNKRCKTRAHGARMCISGRGRAWSSAQRGQHRFVRRNGARRADSAPSPTSF